MMLHQKAAISVLLALPILAFVAFVGGSKASVPALNNNPACLDLGKVNGTVIEFGRQGKVPYRIAITPKGEINTTASPGVLPAVPSINLKTERLSPTTVKALIQLANGTNFWNLPEAIGQKNSKNDESWFVTVNSPCTNHSVVLYDRSKTDSDAERFAQMYSLLADLVKLDRPGYKPVK
jgi:hypothetical protein